MRCARPRLGRYNPPLLGPSAIQVLKEEKVKAMDLSFKRDNPGPVRGKPKQIRESTGGEGKKVLKANF